MAEVSGRASLPGVTRPIETRSTPTEPSGHPPGQEVDWRTRDGKPEEEQRNEIGRRAKGDCPPTEPFAECNGPHRHGRDHDSTHERPNDATYTRAREVDRGDQPSQVQASHQEYLSCRHPNLHWPQDAVLERLANAS